MKIFVEPSTFDCLNMGDVAMLQVAVKRLRGLWPSARIHVLTADPIALESHCPDVFPVPVEGRDLWFEQRYFLGRLHGILPSAVSKGLIESRRWLGERSPSLMARAMAAKPGISKNQNQSIESFLGAIEGADLVVMTGSGTLSDVFRHQAILCLWTLAFGIARGGSGVMLGQGIGPLANNDLLGMLRSLAPRLRLVTLREGIEGPRVLRHAGLPSDRMMVTGDEALELGYVRRGETLGVAIGINLRVAAHSGIGPESIEPVASALLAVQQTLGASMEGIPIAVHQFSRDHEILRQLMAHMGIEREAQKSVRSPADVIETVGRCRVVITAAYHAAVFALSQGVPVVTLSHSRNQYYALKFGGLAALFPGGVESVFVDTEDFPRNLREKSMRLWEDAHILRDDLLDRTLKQIDTGRDAYLMLRA